MAIRVMWSSATMLGMPSFGRNSAVDYRFSLLYKAGIGKKGEVEVGNLHTTSCAISRVLPVFDSADKLMGTSDSVCPLSATMSSDLKSKFLQVYDFLKSELIHDPSFEFDDDTRQWVTRMLDYNVPTGKLTRGLCVVESYMLLKGEELTDDEFFLACVLGWCNEWMEAYLCVLDDIMDESQTRRAQPCWYRLPKVGMIALNDGVILRNQVARILKKHFGGKTYYVDLLDLLNEVEYQTACGEMMDLITPLAAQKDLSKYSLSIHHRVAKYKTAIYSFYLPVACALVMFGENLNDHVQVKHILVEIGILFQVQNDYLDSFGVPEVMGKIGRDIEDFKCSWLVVKALELANNEQKKLLNENYGRKDPASVTKVNELYHTLNLQAVFEDYENTSHEKLMKSIKAHPSKAVQAMLESSLGKIYKRKK